MQSAQISQSRWNGIHEERLRQRGSRSLRMRKPTNGFGGAKQWSAVRAPGKEAHPRTAEGKAGHRHRDSVVIGNERADEWETVTAEAPDAHRVEWLNYVDQEEVWSCACQAGDLRDEAGGSAPVGCGTDIHDKIPKSRTPGDTFAGSTKRLVSPL